jgi:hypothetical protein
MAGEGEVQLWGFHTASETNNNPGALLQNHQRMTHAAGKPRSLAAKDGCLYVAADILPETQRAGNPPRLYGASS